VLAHAQRLRRAADFSSVVRHGARAGSSLIVVHVLGPDPADHGTRAPARAGFIVSRSIGNAVTRNRVVRRLRHLTRLRLPALPEGSLLVVRALPAAAAATSTDLGDALDDCLHRARRSAMRGSS
jgi:ribonuclease P protein component